MSGYRTITAAALLGSKTIRGFVASTLKNTGFKWYDSPAKELPAGSEFTGENLIDAKFFQRGGKLFLSVVRFEGGGTETERVLRIRYPVNIGSHFIFVDRSPPGQ